MALFSIPIKKMYFGVFLLLSSLTFLFSGCFGCAAGSCKCDGGPGDDCGRYVKCIDTFFVDNTLMNQLLPDTFKSQIKFKNSNGFITFFNSQLNENNEFSPEDLTYKSVSVECGSLSCYDYFLNQSKTTSYKASNVPFSYGYNFSNISTTKSYQYAIDSTLTGYTIASVYVNNSKFDLPNNLPFNANSRVLSTYTINNKSYYNVNQIHLDSASVDKTVIKPIGIFYNESYGLIGFYLTNGETWGLID